MPLANGTKLGPYEIQGAIGAGGMGEVYRARDSRLGRDVAIKILAPHTSADPGAVARLAQEARLVAALSHPAIVTIHDVGEEAGQFYLVTELLEGETLRRRLAAGPLPWRRGLDDAITIASALAAAHARDIVHRDLKPENIFCTADGVKILDFGVAKVVALPDAATTIKAAVRTEAGTTVGTLAYMAPEQLDGRPLDHRTDQFAFGILLHEMLAGTRPFGGATTHETVAAILRDEPSSLASLRPELPPALSRIASRCLAKDPQGRYAATADLAVALADVRRDLDAGTAADGRRESPGAHRILPWVAGAVAVAVFVIAATSGFWRATPPDATVTPPSRGLPIIHCHGTPSSRVEGDLTFSGTVAAELGVRIIVPDRPGMGRSDFQPARRIVDWPDDVLQLAAALELDTFAVLGSSGGAPYAAACGALIPNRIRVIGLLGGVAPVDAPGMLAAMSAPLRVMVQLSRFAPAVVCSGSTCG